MARVYLSLGSNLGDRKKNLARARGEISRLPGTRLIKSSSIYKTDPVLPRGACPQDYYFNLSLCVETELTPQKLLEHLLKIESRLGRVRRRKNDPRPIDTDIVYYDRKILRQKNLVIPHPRLHLRRFVLKPLCELAPRFRDPVRQKTVAELLKSAPADQKISQAPRTPTCSK